MKKNFCLHKISFGLLNIGFFLLIPAAESAAQITLAPTPAANDSGDDMSWWYFLLGILVLALAGVVIWLMKSKKAEKEIAVQKQAAQKKHADIWETGSLDADKELEWLRKNQNIINKKRKKDSTKKNAAQKESLEADGNAPESSAEPEAGELPVFSIESLEPAQSFSPLPISNDDALISAIEQTHDEYEEDEEVRDLAVRILTAFKTRNSVEALSQVALYDLSSSLRSKAVLTLTEFDHESVFETILLACADPSREVRAAAARGLTRLSFDRADAWARIAETGEEGRIGQSARAAVESGFVARSFDRLVHTDKQNVYEAFVLLALLIRAGETEQIFEALKNHKDMNVRLAILHLIKVTKDQNALNELYNLLEDKKLPEGFRAEVDRTIEEIGLVAV